MTANRSTAIVNFWKEGDPLRHVIVSVATGTIAQAPKPATQRDWPQAGFTAGIGWLLINTLMLDSHTICAQAGETAQTEQFDKLGFEAVPVPFWDVAALGGGLHCATADLHREGTLQNHSPKQIPGY